MSLVKVTTGLVFDKSGGVTVHNHKEGGAKCDADIEGIRRLFESDQGVGVVIDADLSTGTSAKAQGSVRAPSAMPFAAPKVNNQVQVEQGA